MSSTFSPLLRLLLLLSLAFCPCNSRPIGEIKTDNPLARSSALSSKDEEKSSSVARVSISSNTNQPSNLNEPKPAKTDSSVVENMANDQPKRNQNVEHHEPKDDQRHKVGGAVAVTVSWKLPHPKAGEQEPGFNLDYDPPQTHPGIHN